MLAVGQQVIDSQGVNCQGVDETLVCKIWTIILYNS